MKCKLLTFLSLFIIVLFLNGCGMDGAKKNTTTPSAEKVEKVETQVIEKMDLTPLPGVIFKKLYEEADYLDVIFEDLPFSMSQDDNNSIKQFLVNVDVSAPDYIDKSCTPMGHQIYQKEGIIIAEADFYVSDKCNYYVFTIEGEKYYNKMMPNGIVFYNKLKSGDM